MAITDPKIKYSRDMRLLKSISQYGAESIPYDMEFITKYKLKELFFTWMDSCTSKDDSLKELRLLNKHIKSYASSVLPESLKNSDKYLLEYIEANGIAIVNNLFLDSEKTIKEFLEEYDLTVLYTLYVDFINNERITEDKVKEGIVYLQNEIRKHISNYLNNNMNKL